MYVYDDDVYVSTVISIVIILSSDRSGQSIEFGPAASPEYDIPTYPVSSYTTEDLYIDTRRIRMV